MNEHHLVLRQFVQRTDTPTCEKGITALLMVDRITTSFPKAVRSGFASKVLPKPTIASPICWKFRTPRARRSLPSMPCVIATVRAITSRGNSRACPEGSVVVAKNCVWAVV